MHDAIMLIMLKRNGMEIGSEDRSQSTHLVTSRVNFPARDTKGHLFERHFKKEHRELLNLL